MNMQEAQNYLNDLRSDSTPPNYTNLAHIIDTFPDLKAEALEAFQKGLSSEKNNSASLTVAYMALAETAKVAQPEQIPQVLDLYKKALASEKNSGSLSEAYHSLAEIAKTVQPEQVPQVLELFEKPLISDKNNFASFRAAYMELSSVARACPKQIPQILDLCKLGLANKRNLDLGDALTEGHKVVDNLTQKAQPQQKTNQDQNLKAYIQQQRESR